MDKIDTDSATISGFWIGIAGFITGLISIGLTLYFSFKAKPDVLILTSSGWLAAVVCALACGWLGHRLVKLAASLGQRVADLTAEVAHLKNEHQRLIVISEFLASKSIRHATPRKISAPTVNLPEAENDNPI